MEQVRQHHINYHVMEPERYNQSWVEGVIREIRKKWVRVMTKKYVPKMLWDYGLRWVVEIMQRTASDAGMLHGRSGLEKATRETPEISKYIDFGFYDPCWYKENAGMGKTKMGRWLGVSHKTGSLMSFWVLMPSCHVVSRTSVQRITNFELQEETNKRRMTAFDDAVKEYLQDYNHVLNDGGKSEPYDWSTHPFEDDPDFQEEFEDTMSNPKVKEADELFTPDTYDQYLQMELALPQWDSLEPRLAKVTKRLEDANGIPIGMANQNPLLDTRMYEVEFTDGEKAFLAANSIAENLFAQIDDEGNRQVLMNEIIDYQTNGTELKQQDAFITTKTGTKRGRETTKGLELLIEWKDGSTNRVSLKDIKESYLVQVAKFALATHISMEPAFAWWVAFMLKKRNRILAKVKSKYWLRAHKFGIRIPKSVEEAKKIDEHNGDTLWWDAICKAMKNVHPTFEVFEGREDDIPKDYQFMQCHMIFDMKFGENFQCKVRLVAGGHMTNTPNTLTYSSVVSRDSVRIALTILALNELSVMACDTQKAYLTVDCRGRRSGRVLVQNSVPKVVLS